MEMYLGKPSTGKSSLCIWYHQIKGMEKYLEQNRYTHLFLSEEAEKLIQYCKDNDEVIRP